MSQIYAKPFQTLYHLTILRGGESDIPILQTRDLRLRERKNLASPTVAKLVTGYQRKAHPHNLTSELQLEMTTLV